MKNIGSATEEEWRRTRRIVTYGFVALLVLVGAAVVVSVYLRTLGPGPWPVFPFGGFGWIWAIFAFFFVFWFLRWGFWPWRPYPYHWRNTEDAVAVLRARYARGEITKEQFDKMRRDLE